MGVDEDNEWIAEGLNIEGLIMSAPSLDVLVFKTNIALSDLVEKDKFEVTYKFTEPLKIDYAVDSENNN
jgi:hypothetical protein